MENSETVVREKVDLSKNDGKLLIFESERDVSNEEIAEHCEANEMEVPEEGSEGYWEIVNFLREIDWESFIGNLSCSRKLPEKAVITGALGLWNGPHRIVPKIADLAGDPKGFFQKFALEGDFSMEVGYDNDGLFVRVHHHDGSNCFRVLEVTGAGERYLERCKRHGEEPEMLMDEALGYTAKIDYWLY